MSDYDADRDAVIKRALDQGIENIITIGIGRKECEQALELARVYPFIYAALGLHPHNAKKDAARLYDFIKESVSNKKVVALGEMGLDFFKNWSPQQDQIRCFHEQLAMARELKLPVIIHDRDAHAETVSNTEGGAGRGGRRRDTLLFGRLPNGRRLYGYGILYFHTGHHNF